MYHKIPHLISQVLPYFYDVMGMYDTPVMSEISPNELKMRKLIKDRFRNLTPEREEFLISILT